MDSDTVVPFVVIGIPTIVWGAYAAFRTWISHEERKIKLLGEVRGTSVNEPTIARLESEIAAVRETSTQYDLSIQHALDQIQQRLDVIESQTSATKSSVNTARYATTDDAAPETLTNGQGPTRAI